MNKQQAATLPAGQRVTFKLGSLPVFGRVLDQSLHSPVTENGCVAVARNGDVYWIEPRKLGLAGEPVRVPR